MERLRRLRADISHNDSAERFTKLGIDVYMGRGEFTSPSTVKARTLHHRHSTGTRSKHIHSVMNEV